MLLIDDPERTVIEPLSGERGEMEGLYDFDLQQGGGHLKGWRLTAEQMDAVASALAELGSPEAMEKADACMGCHFHPPVLLAVAYDPAEAWDREDDGKNHGEIDATIAVTQMMLQAADLGLGTTYVGMFDPEKLTAAFPEMAGLVPIAMLPLGYPAEGAHPARLHTDRKSMEQLVKYL